MITYRQLWAADPDAWRRAGAAWCRVLGSVGQRRAELTQVDAKLRAHWSGPTARSAGAVLAHLADRLDASRPAFVAADQILAEHAATLTQAKAMLDATVTAAAGRGVRIDRHGTASPDPAVPQPGGQAEAAVRETSAGIRAALELATATDRRTARSLGELATAAAHGWPAEPPADRPGVGADPVAVRAWWEGLTAAQRRWLIGHEPALVGRLDGVPVTARDQANRLLLDGQRADLLQQRVRLLADPAAADRSARLRRIDDALTGLDAVGARLAAGSGPRAYLLGLDPSGDGRVVVAVGNPDRADNVLTYVPGMTSDLRSADGELERAFRVAQRCAELGPTEQTAAILWLDYDAPDFVDEAFRASYAHDAGPALHRFQEGLRATHDGRPAHQTVLGHSYGSLVVGTTARDYGLAADSLVFVGSPGVGVDHARDLNAPPGQVWASTARDDVIQYLAPSVDQALEQLGLGVAVPVVGPLLALATPDDELWFGHNPAHPDFGARVFYGDPNGHTGYWDRDNPALDGMARIALGGQHQATVR